MKLHLSLCLCLCMCVYVCVSQKILKHNSSKIHPTLYYMNFWQKPRCIQNGNFVRVQMTESSNVGVCPSTMKHSPMLLHGTHSKYLTSKTPEIVLFGMAVEINLECWAICL